MVLLGSPLNRLSFLRSEHPFLSVALKHPSTRFILLNNLAPLTKSPSELHYASFGDVCKLVPEDLYDQSEEDMIKNFDSRKTIPHVIFLGMEEIPKPDSLTWKIYKGTPYFAVDVTPRGSEEQQAHAKDIISTMEAKGLNFFKSRVVMTLSADEGLSILSHGLLRLNNSQCLSCHLCPSSCPHRLEHPEQLLRHLRSSHACCKLRH